MEVRKGYKHTDVGDVPETWDVVTLEKVALILDPQPDHRTPPSAFDGEPYIGISDFVNDKKVNWDASRKIISKAVDKQQSSFQINSGDIIFGKIGTIGQPKFVPVVPFRYALSANVLLIKPIIEPYYLMSWLQSSNCQRAINRELHSTSQAAFGIYKMRQVLIALPPTLAEQKAIAEALSDADALIEAVEQLLAKKRQVKQGAMSELLTGKRRLSEFNKEWVTNSLGSLAELYQPVTISAKQFTEAGFPVYGANGVVGFYNMTNHDTWQVTVTCRGSTCGTVNRTVDRCWITGNAMVLNCDNNENIDKEFFYHLLCGQDLSDCITGTGQPQIVRSPLAAVQVFLPSDMKEQTAIAEILSDMDAENSALEENLVKARQVKAGMMSELLTGKIRLV